MAALLEPLAARTRLTERILRHEGRERTLTDLRHVAQLRNREARTRRLGHTALIRWLSARMAEDQPVTSADRSRMLARDSAAIHIVTIHAAKGLEYPVVYLPFGWDGSKPRDVDALLLHEGDRKSTRLNSSHVKISYAVFCLKKKKQMRVRQISHIISIV